MHKIGFFVISLVLASPFFFLAHTIVHAQSDTRCPNKYIQPSQLTDDNFKYNKIDFGVQVNYDVNETDPLQKFAFVADNGQGNDYISEWKTANGDNQIFGNMVPQFDPDQFTSNSDGSPRSHRIRMFRLGDQSNPSSINPNTQPSINQLSIPYCESDLTYVVYSKAEPTVAPQLSCDITTVPDKDITSNTNVKLVGKIIPKVSQGSGLGTQYTGFIDYHGAKALQRYFPQNGEIIDVSLGLFSDGDYKITYWIEAQEPRICSGSICTDPKKQKVCERHLEFHVGNNINTTIIPPSPTPNNPSTCYFPNGLLNCDTGNNFTQCIGCDGYDAGSKKITRQLEEVKPLCENISAQLDEKQLESCKRCVYPLTEYPYLDGINYKGIWTAIGCVPTDPIILLNQYILAAAGFGIAGGVAFLYFLYGAFLILTSMGNPERINEGKEIMISSISGLLLILFSVFILQVIGVDILKIPEFGSGPSQASPPPSNIR